jgi:nucleoid-associated protein YgaU
MTLEDPMSIFEIVNPVEKAKAALAEAQKAKADQYAKGAIDAMNAAIAATKQVEADKAAAAAAAEARKWKDQEETIEEALEHAGISGIDIQIDDTGFARVLGTVTNVADRDTAVAMVEQFPINGMEVQVDVVTPPEPEPAPAGAASGPSKYTVKAGESWWGIAARTYGDGTLWKALKAANNNPRMIHPGTEIVMPAKDDLKK